MERIAGQALSPHAGPQAQALQLDADPLAAPLVPDIGISPPPELGTAVGAAFFAMMQNYGEGVTPGAFQVRVLLDSRLHLCPVNVCATCSSCIIYHNCVTIANAEKLQKVRALHRRQRAT